LINRIGLAYQGAGHVQHGQYVFASGLVWHSEVELGRVVAPSAHDRLHALGLRQRLVALGLHLSNLAIQWDRDVQIAVVIAEGNVRARIDVSHLDTLCLGS
jgi:hypothetical protein